MDLEKNRKSEKLKIDFIYLIIIEQNRFFDQFYSIFGQFVIVFRSILRNLLQINLLVLFNVNFDRFFLTGEGLSLKLKG